MIFFPLNQLCPFHVVMIFINLKQNVQKASTLELTFDTAKQLIEGYKKDIADAKLHELFRNLQMEYMLADNSNSSKFEIIKSLDIVNDAIVSEITKYGELIKMKANVERVFSDYQNECQISENLINFEDDWRSTGLGITFVMARISKLAQMYHTFITFSLEDIEKLNKIIADPNISWWNVHIEDRITLIQKFTNRLIPCANLLKICSKSQPAAINALSGMLNIFNDLKNFDADLEFFLNKFKILLDEQKDGIIGEDFQHILDKLSNKMKKMPNECQNLYNASQKFHEIKDSNAFDDDVLFWKSKVNVEKLVPQAQKRKFAHILVSGNLDL